jgi:hypothetical protein
MSLEKIDKITNLSQSLKKINQVSPQEIFLPDRDFRVVLQEQNLQAQATSKGGIEQEGMRPSLLEEARKANNSTITSKNLTTKELAAQLETTVKQMDTVKLQLGQANIDIKNAVQRNMQKKLKNVDSSIKTALNKVGTNPQAIEAGHEPENSIMTPIERFLGMLTQSQNDLNLLSNDVMNLASADRTSSPAMMLTLQMKVSRIQYEVELFSNLLNKALESTKTIMNVQV